MKKILPAFLLLMFIQLRCQAQSHDATYLGLGAEHHLDTGWQVTALSIDISLMHKSPRWFSDYRLSLGLNAKNQFYIHAPVSAVLLAGMIVGVFTGGSNGNCYGAGEMVETLLKIPEGFTWQFYRSEKWKTGAYLQALSLDFLNKKPKWDIDWVPEIGVKARYYLKKDFFFHFRASGAYSVRFHAPSAIITGGVGWNLE